MNQRLAEEDEEDKRRKSAAAAKLKQLEQQMAARNAAEAAIKGGLGATQAKKTTRDLTDEVGGGAGAGLYRA